MAAFCFAFYESYISMVQTERGGEMGPGGKEARRLKRAGGQPHSKLLLIPYS
jgi:hypothetical protein